MTGQPPNFNSSLSPEQAQGFLQQLRRKEGTWVEWGKLTQLLQKAGYDSNTLFEETGIEPIQQNLIVVASQVYDSLLKEKASEPLQVYFLGPRSDVLYEFRILNQQQRLEAAQFAQEKGLDVDGAHKVARSIKEFSRYSNPPEGFTTHPGDTVAYQCWRAARGKKDLQERSRLIAEGLRFVHSETARKQIERLLSDFTVVSTAKAPILPLYRLEVEEDLPKIIPVAGAFPLTREVFEAVPRLEAMEPFRMVNFSGEGSFLPVPGWQVVLRAEDPIGILAKSEDLPESPLRKPENLVVVVDRAVQKWDQGSYFLVEQEKSLSVQWFPDAPEWSILGKVILILRAKSILDEGNLTEPWQMDD